MKKLIFKKPRSCQIGALKFKIRYLLPGKGELLEEGELGAVSQTEHLIEIDKSISAQMTRLVLIHEMLHAIGDCIQPNKNPFNKESFTSTVAELLVQALQSAKLLSS